VAALVFVGDVFLHLPITDFCDMLVRRYGFLTFDGTVRRAFATVGLAALAASWLSPTKTIRAMASAMTILLGVTVCAQLLIVVNAIEDVHYPQYALLAFLIARGTSSAEAGWLAATVLGAIDEGYQFAALPRGTPAYYDWNDVVLNGIGAAFGAVIVLMLDRGNGRRVVSWRAMVPIGATACLTALLLSPPTLSAFFTLTPGGRRFHQVPSWEALPTVLILWGAVRYWQERTAADGSAPARPAA
jgi:hypothetical protein